MIRQTSNSFFIQLISKTVLISLIFLLVLNSFIFVFDYTTYLNSSQKSVDEDVSRISSSLEGELYLNNVDSLNYLKTAYSSQYKLHELLIEKNKMCDNKDKINFVSEYISCKIVKFSENDFFRIIARRMIPYSPSARLVNFIVGTVTSSVMLFVATFTLLLISFRKKVLYPLEELSKNPSKEVAPDSLSEIEILSHNFRKYIEVERVQLKRDAFFMMAKSVAHDIRQPLSALKAILYSELTPAQSTKILSAAVNRIESILSDLSTEPTHNPIQMNSLAFEINSLIDQFRLTYPNCKIKSTYVGSNELNVGPETTWIIRVLSNLLKNSTEASKEIGKIEVEVKLNEQKVSFRVDDDGCGFPDSVVRLIGRKSITYDKIGGSGLGLLTAFRHVNGHGGEFKVQNLSSGGASVEFILPLHLFTAEKNS